MFNERFSIFAVLSFLSCSALAQEYPEDGWWWNPAEPGRGYLIERQDNVMFIASFHYAADGLPQWLTIQGVFTPDVTSTTEIGTFVGDTFESVNGQCIACAYEMPTTSDSAQGVAILNFSSNQTGTFAWEGETIPIERTLWSFGGTLEQLSGQWALSTLESGVGSMQLVQIETDSDTSSAISSLSSGASVGSISSSDDGLSLILDQDGVSLSVKMPETNRFYAGESSADATQVVATRIDDVPLETAADSSSELPLAFLEFGSNVIVVGNIDEGTVTLEAAGRPDHPSPYWDPDGDSGLYVEAGPETTVTRMSPGFIESYTNRYFLTVPINPELADSPTNTSLGAIGIAITGAPIFNDQEGPADSLNQGVISGFDNYGAHTGPQVYHYHLEPTPITN